MNEIVDDKKTQDIINKGITTEPTAPREPAPYRIGRTFRKLQKQRQTISPNDINLAAAEHYMYMRYLGGLTGDPIIYLAPDLYTIKKKIYFFLGIEKKMQVTGHPVLPPNRKVTEWGRKGVVDGISDYRSTNPGKSLNPGKGIKDLKDEAYRTNAT